MSTFRSLPRDTNQALGLAQYAIDFIRDGRPSPAVLDRVNLFHTDATLCGLSALALGTNAPVLLRREAMQYAVPPGNHAPGLGNSRHHGATFFGSLIDGKQLRVKAEKAILANSAAVREWDSNGTNFGYDPARNNIAGEFGHNDFYPVCIAAAQMLGADGSLALRGMVCLDEIRGRLAEVFSLKSYKVDHVVHGAIGSAATFGAMVGATAAQIESAIGMFVAHHIPFRAIRAGKQLSDSKGSSAAISTEAAIMCVKRSMAGFLGPRDIFRNPEAIFRIFEGPGQMFQKVGAAQAAATKAATAKQDASPFDLHLAMHGDDFTVMGMHFKLGLYEHQSAGALQAIITLLSKSPSLLASPDAIKSIRIVAYEPAFGIIGDPAKRKPTTRQSADHSMVYIVATLLRKAIESKRAGWTELMLAPDDYSPRAIEHALTRKLMDKIEFAHGGPDYDRRYPDGIPTSVVITDSAAKSHDSGLVMYPGGHARNHLGETPVDLKAILAHKFALLAGLVQKNHTALITRFSNLDKKSPADIQSINDIDLNIGPSFEA